jgi:hypothetical protein
LLPLLLLLPLQEAVLLPSCCPAEVRPLLAAAQAAHQSRQVDDAVALYGMAEEAWRDCLQQQQHSQVGEHAEEAGQVENSVL